MSAADTAYFLEGRVCEGEAADTAYFLEGRGVRGCVRVRVCGGEGV